jgi:hypothetical protein
MNKITIQMIVVACFIVMASSVSVIYASSDPDPQCVADCNIPYGYCCDSAEGAFIQCSHNCDIQKEQCHQSAAYFYYFCSINNTSQYCLEFYEAELYWCDVIDYTACIGPCNLGLIDANSMCQGIKDQCIAGCPPA